MKAVILAMLVFGPLLCLSCSPGFRGGEEVSHLESSKNKEPDVFIDSRGNC